MSTRSSTYEEEIIDDQQLWLKFVEETDKVAHLEQCSIRIGNMKTEENREEIITFNSIGNILSQ